jgi:phosphatidylglycerophosphate synthase
MFRYTLYFFISSRIEKNMFNRLNINIFMIAGLLVGIVFEVLLNFGQASMSDYFNLKAFLLFIILQVSLINAGNYLLKTFNFF